MDDHQLLNLYVTESSDDAFKKLFDRHCEMVFSTAYRITKNHALASDIMQSVFIMLFKKASTLNKNVILAGWLFNTTRFVSLSALREKNIRNKYEKQVSFYAKELSYSNEKKKNWKEIEPYINEALASMREKERSAILLYYFEKRSSQEIADELKMRAPAVRKMISRSLKTMEKKLSKKGLVISSLTLGILLQENSIYALSPRFSLQEIFSRLLKYNQGPFISKRVMSFTEKGLEVLFYKKVKSFLTYSASILLLSSSALLSSFEFNDKNLAPENDESKESKFSVITSFNYLSRQEYLELLKDHDLTDQNWEHIKLKDYSFSGSLESFMLDLTFKSGIEVIWTCTEQNKNINVELSNVNTSHSEILNKVLKKYQLNHYFKHGKLHINNQVFMNVANKNNRNLEKPVSLSTTKNSLLSEVVKELTHLSDIEILLDPELIKRESDSSLLIKNPLHFEKLALKHILNYCEQSFENVEWQFYQDKVFFLLKKSSLHKEILAHKDTNLNETILDVYHPGGIGLSNFWEAFYQFSHVKVKFEDRNDLEKYFLEALIIPSFELRNVTYKNLLDFICQKAQLNWKQNKDQIILSYSKDVLFKLSEHVGITDDMNKVIVRLNDERPFNVNHVRSTASTHLTKLSDEIGFKIFVDPNFNTGLLFEKKIEISEQSMSFAKNLNLICDHFKPEHELLILIQKNTILLKTSNVSTDYDRFINEYISSKT